MNAGDAKQGNLAFANVPKLLAKECDSAAQCVVKAKTHLREMMCEMESRKNKDKHGA